MAQTLRMGLAPCACVRRCVQQHCWGHSLGQGEAMALVRITGRIGSQLHLHTQQTSCALRAQESLRTTRRRRSR